VVLTGPKQPTVDGRVDMTELAWFKTVKSFKNLYIYPYQGQDSPIILWQASETSLHKKQINHLTAQVSRMPPL